MKALIFSAVICALAGSAMANDPQALIMDVIGESDPEVGAFEELNEGASVALAKDAEITLTFYPTCEDISVKGGTIAISDAKLAISGGEIVSRAPGECPGHVKMSPSDIVNASIVTRSVKPRPWISPTPLMIGIIGEGAEGYTHIGVYGKDHVVFQSELDGRSAVWPAGIEPLTLGEQYLVVLTGPEIQMYAARVLADDEAPRITVLRRR